MRNILVLASFTMILPAYSGAISSSSTRSLEIFSCSGVQPFSANTKVVVGFSRGSNSMIGILKDGRIEKRVIFSAFDYYDYLKDNRRIGEFVRFIGDGVQLDIHLDNHTQIQKAYLFTSWTDEFGLFGGALECTRADGMWE